MNFKTLADRLVKLKQCSDTLTLKQAITIIDPKNREFWIDEITFFFNSSTTTTESITALKTYFPEGI